LPIALQNPAPGSEIAGYALDLPITIACRVWTIATSNFLGLLGFAAIDVGSSRLGLGKRAEGGLRQCARLVWLFRTCAHGRFPVRPVQY
jgi:hypothetical protein